MRWPKLNLSLAMLLLSGQAIAEQRWLPVREIGLEIKAGSPLDLSGQFESWPINYENRILPDAGGHFVRASHPDQPIRFSCAAIGWGPPSAGTVNHAFIDRYVRQLKLHGYNIARFHFVDIALMDGRDGDFNFDPAALDRIHYLMAQLKKNGIYWIFDGLTSDHGAYGGKDLDRWTYTRNLKLDTYFDEAAFQHWVQYQKAFFQRVNPYTGLAPFDDPALALIIPFNENGLEFNSFVFENRNGNTPFADQMQGPFNRFLQEKYLTTQALIAAWGRVDSGENLEKYTVKLPRNRYQGGRRLYDFQGFLIAEERKLAARMSTTLRELGYRGAISPYNNLFTVQTSLSRANQQIIAANTYHDWIGTYHPGTTLTQTSSLANGVAFMGEIAIARWLDRPFVVSEYDQLFWNRYRYEAGLTMSAYGALQDWSMLCRHGNGPVTLAYGEDIPFRQRLLPYTFALDPVARAGETLATLLFRRGDVRAADFKIPLIMNGEQDLGESVETREPDHLKLLMLLGGIGLKMRGEQVKPDDPEPVTYRSIALETVVNELRERNFLPPNNRTNVQKGIFESGTGQILLDREQMWLQVVTQQTEALAFAELTVVHRLGKLTLANATGRGLFAVSSLDGKPLDTSKKILVIFASDARNSGMRFQDTDEKIIEDWGNLPVVILENSLDVRMASAPDNQGNWTIAPVGLDGKLYAPLASGKGNIAVRLNNTTHNIDDKDTRPTTYFLIERE